jgi:hypothetical protein
VTNAKKMAADGFQTALDGFLGDVLLGGTYYTSDKYFSAKSKYLRYFTQFVDQTVSRVGMDVIVEALYQEILELWDNHDLEKYLIDDFIAMIDREKGNILQDIYEELNRLRPDNDSCAILFRNFKLLNRGFHAIVQQGVMSRQHIQVFYPFTNDFNLLEQLLKIRPTVTAYRKHYIRLFRKNFKHYADIPISSSMLPIRKAPFFHKLSEILMKKNASFPMLTGKKVGVNYNYNLWHSWLRESALLRDKAAGILCENGIGTNHIQETLENIRNNSEIGSGKLFHLAGIARWFGISNDS